MDIEGAFNNVTTESITNALIKKGTPQIICNWIKSNQERVISSSVGLTTVMAKTDRGCPQGSVLSPLLWSVLAKVVREKYAETIMDRTQGGLNLVSVWCGRQGLTVNPKKTTAVAFTRKSALDRLRLPSLNSVEIPLADEAKYRGVIFERRLTWNKHIEHDWGTKSIVHAEPTWFTIEGPELFFGLPKCHAKRSIKKWTKFKSQQ